MYFTIVIKFERRICVTFYFKLFHDYVPHILLRKSDIVQDSIRSTIILYNAPTYAKTTRAVNVCKLEKYLIRERILHGRDMILQSETDEQIQRLLRLHVSQIGYHR